MPVGIDEELLLKYSSRTEAVNDAWLLVQREKNRRCV
jgi:hypothetical protein